MIDLTNIEFYKNPDDNWKEEKINKRKINIPIDWSFNKIKDIVDNENRLRKDISSMNRKCGYIPYYSSGGIMEYQESVSVDSKDNNYFFVGRVGANWNKYSKTTSFLINGKACISDKVNLMKVKNVNRYYIHTYLNFKDLNEYVVGSVVPTLNGSDLFNINIELPNSLEEQEKIATILETQENLILSKKELLGKYKKQRKYFQQELLSGRIRMKLNNKSMAEAFELGLIKQTFLNDANEVVEYGSDTITNVNIDIIDKDCFENWLSIDFENKIEFYKNIDFKEEKINGRIISIPEDFINFKLNDIFTFEKGKNAGIFTNDYINKNKGLFPVYSGKTGNNGIFGNINTFLYDLKNVLFITTVGKKAMSINLLNGKFSLSQNCALLLNKTNNNDLFLYYIVDKIMFEERIKLSSGVKPSFRKSDMNDINIFLPNVIEQTLIGEQLRKIDNLIESLEEEIKLEYKKFTYLKQELLSGRIRVN